MLTEKAKWQMDSEGSWLCIQAPPNEAKRICAQLSQGKKYTVEIKEYHERRSQRANNYLWALLDKMAEAKSRMDGVACTKDDLYLDYIRECGPFMDFDLTEDEAKEFQKAWHSQGKGWPTERVDFTPDGERVIIRGYYGSSTYKTRRMSRLLDLVIQDAKALGIETATPEEIARMESDWRAR